MIAYQYTPPKVNDCHIHFHLMVDGKRNFLAPAIFTPEIAKQFHDQCNRFRWINDGKAIPSCLGFRIGPRRIHLGRERPCPFLGADSKCTIYDVRPEKCRGYPFTDKPDFAFSTITHANNAVVCPAVFYTHWSR